MATGAWEMFAFNVNTDSQVLEFFNNKSSKVWKYRLMIKENEN